MRVQAREWCVEQRLASLLCAAVIARWRSSAPGSPSVRHTNAHQRTPSTRVGEYRQGSEDKQHATQRTRSRQSNMSEHRTEHWHGDGMVMAREQRARGQRGDRRTTRSRVKIYPKLIPCTHASIQLAYSKHISYCFSVAVDVSRARDKTSISWCHVLFVGRRT